MAIIRSKKANILNIKGINLNKEERNLEEFLIMYNPE